jgi:pilus assembly protein Flp/PilA
LDFGRFYFEINLALIALGQDQPVTNLVQETTTMTMLKKLFKDESGATAIEYGLIAALIAVAIITAATTVGTNLSATFTSVSSKL